MTDKALISSLTWRSLDMQKKAFPDMPHYIMPDEMSYFLRPSRRDGVLNIHVLSLGIIADKERDFLEFAKEAFKRGAVIFAKETGKKYSTYSKKLIIDWMLSRREGAAKKGGEASAKAHQERFWPRFAIIANRWHMESKWPSASAPLLKEAGLTRNTVKSYLGYNREEWQRMTDAKRARILKGKI